MKDNNDVEILLILTQIWGMIKESKCCSKRNIAKLEMLLNIFHKKVTG